MAVDDYPSEEAYLNDGHVIGWCMAGGSITLHDCVAMTTNTVGNIEVVAGSSDGDSVGVALKTAASGAILPVVFYGVCKMLVTNATVAAGGMVQNDSSPQYVIPITSFTIGTALAQLELMKGLNYSGTDCVLGMALQTSGGTTGDEILVLIGKQI